MTSFLMRFRQEVPAVSPEEMEPESEYNEEQQMSVLVDGALVWRTRTKRPPTGCYTTGHRIPSGYTRSGKWKPSKWIPGKTDKRVGK